ncbi:DUF1499 domain-containing protein [Neptunomonas marina]|uniref:DUF1499 domain-containing protein n=1 Tax=Neptunomonas marina TaxID=1815562 RepID=A0A437QD36_9GAMM|nr:DUF1499 domain-containing protein [Neptunomonas marina]RVU32365.1 DUF1499 domain-containing protein [Neptunomonas marina]
MKLLIAVLLLIGLGLAAFSWMAVQSRGGKAPGLREGQLAPCGAQPNCVSSYPGTPTDKLIKPVFYPQTLTQDEVESLLIKAITDTGGLIETMEGGYMAAIYRSKLFGFVDDMELLVDHDSRVIHLRSASRVGYSDLGANRKRAEQLRSAILSTAQLQEQ